VTSIITYLPADRKSDPLYSLPGLSVDLLDLNLCVLLSVAVFLVISGFSLVLVNNDLPELAILYHGSGYGCACNVGTCLETVVCAYCQNLIERNILSCLCAELFNLDLIAFSDLVLFTTLR
jgi:hypothetical protein